MTDSHPSPDGNMPFVEHLIELRNRLLRVILTVSIVFLLLMPFSNYLFSILAAPLLRFMPTGTQMIAIDVLSPLMTPLKLTLVFAIFIAMPMVLYHLWAFIAPGLYKHEKAFALPLLLSSIMLFYAGVAFAYYVAFPLMFAFMVTTTPEGVAMMTDIGRYLDFVLKMFLSFGFAFEIPIATIILISMEIITPADLIAKRPYVIVGAFILGAMLAPEPVTQTLLAVPIWLLFELGLLFSRLLIAKRKPLI